MKRVKRPKSVSRNCSFALLCILLAGVLLCGSAFETSSIEESATSTGADTAPLDTATTPERDGAPEDNVHVTDETTAQENAGQPPAYAPLPPGSSLSTPAAPQATWEVYLVEGEESFEPGEWGPFYSPSTFTLVFSDPEEEFENGDVIATLSHGSTTEEITLPSSGEEEGEGAEGDRIYTYSFTVNESCVLAASSSPEMVWKIGVTEPPAIPEDAISLMYGEVRAANTVSLFNPLKNYTFKYTGIYLFDGASRVFLPANSAGLVLLPSPYTIDGRSTVSLNDYLKLTHTRRFADGYNTLTALAPTESAVTVTPSEGEPYAISFTIEFKRLDSAKRYQAIVSPAHLYLANPAEFLFGSKVLHHANLESFLKDHIVAGTNQSNTQPFDSARFIWNLNGVFADPTAVIGYSEPLGVYPDPATGTTLTWVSPANIAPEHAGKILLESSSLSATFSFADTPTVFDLLKNTEGEALIEDPLTGMVWSRTPELSYAPQNSLYDGFSLASSLDSQGRIAVSAPLPISTREASGLFATNSATASDAEYYAVTLDQVHYDGGAPYLANISYLPADVELGGLKGYSESTTLTLTLSDIPVTSEAPASEVSGIADTLALTYQGKDYPYTSHYQLNDDGSAPQTIVIEIELAPSDQRYVLADFELSVTDIAGNSSSTTLAPSSQHHDPDNTTAIIVDAILPEVSLTFDNNDVRNDRYYQANRTASIQITEAHFDAIQQVEPTRVIATIIENGRMQPIELTAELFTNPSDDNKTWIYSYAFTEDGDYGFEINFADFLSHPLANGSLYEMFVIDKTAPVLMVTFNNNEFHSPFYFNAPRLATIDVVERNFDPELVIAQTTAATATGEARPAPGVTSWSTENTSNHLTNIYFNEEYTYNLTVDVTDLAGNVAKTFTEPEFVIDMTKPLITIENVADTQALAEEVTPRITFFDINLVDFDASVDISSISGEAAYQFQSAESVSATTKVLNYENLERVLLNDDIYVLYAHIVDRAGNEAAETVTFSVNRFGSNYLFSPATQALSGAFLAEPEEVVVTEINVSGLMPSEILVKVSANGGVRTLDPEIDYTMETSHDGALWTNNTYTLPASLFSEDGFYRVMFRSVDRAGNLSENTMDFKNITRDAPAELAFAVDTTAPFGSLFGVEDYGVYNQPTLEAGLRATDNMSISYARLLIDGEEVSRFESEGNETSYSETFTIPESAFAQTITLEITDRAGNTTTITKREVFVSSDLFTLIINTPLAQWMGISPLVGLALGAGLVLIAAALSFCVILPLKHKKKMKNAEETLEFRKASS